MKRFSGCRKGNRLLPLLFILAVMLFIPGLIVALNYPSMVYETPEVIGPGTTWQRASNANPSWNINIIRVDLDNRSIQLRPEHREREDYFFRPSFLAMEANAIAATNGTFFGIWPPGSDHPAEDYYGQSTEYCMIDGELLAPNRRGSRPVWGIRHDNSMLQSVIGMDWNAEPSDPNWNNMLHALGGRPTLLENGVKTGEPNWSSDNVRHPRTMMGWSDSDNVVYLVTVDGRDAGGSVGMTWEEQADLLLDLGCDHGINYDGGGSTTAWVKGQIVNVPSDGDERGGVTAMLVIPAYVIDHTDVECTITGNWQVSTDPGYFNTSSLTVDGSESNADVTWRPDLEMTGQYKVYAWYTAGANRPSSVEYTVHDYNGTHSVTVDQQTGGGEWELLGNFVFDTGDEGYVQLDNTAAPGEVLSADAVKFVWTGAGYAEYIINNRDTANTSMTGSWLTGSFPTPWEDDYHFAYAGDGSSTFSFFMDMPESGIYEVYSWWVSGTNRATNARYLVQSSEGVDEVFMNQRQNGSNWNLLGSWFFEEASEGKVTIDNSGDGIVMADAVRFVLLEPSEIMQVSAPQFNPAPGTYSEPQQVTISCSTSNATIHYTTDGSNPFTSGTVQSGNPGESVQVTVPMNTTIQVRAYATHNEYTDSEETSGTYTVEAILTGLEIEGPAELALNSTYQYDARAFFSDGSNTLVTPQWSLIFSETQELLSEDFTGYANQAAFESAWTPFNGSLQLTSVQARSTQSVMQDNTARANYYALPQSYQGSDAEPLILEFWMYDSNPSLINVRHFISLAAYSGGTWGSGTLENLIAMGMHPPSGAYYNARILYGGENWVLTSAERTEGWRKMAIKITGSQIQFYVDDTLAYQNSYTAPATGWNSIRLGSSLSSTNNLTIYYDDIYMYREIVSQDPPATIDTNGFLTTGSVDGEGTLNASYTSNDSTQSDSLDIFISAETVVSDWMLY